MSTNDLSEKYINEIILPKINVDNQVIYIIKLNGICNLTEALNKYKSSDANIKLPKINKENFNNTLHKNFLFLQKNSSV